MKFSDVFLILGLYSYFSIIFLVEETGQGIDTKHIINSDILYPAKISPMYFRHYHFMSKERSPEKWVKWLMTFMTLRNC
jgi:hypothetical protein